MIWYLELARVKQKSGCQILWQQCHFSDLYQPSHIHNTSGTKLKSLIQILVDHFVRYVTLVSARPYDSEHSIQHSTINHTQDHCSVTLIYSCHN